MDKMVQKGNEQSKILIDIKLVSKFVFITFLVFIILILIYPLIHKSFESSFIYFGNAYLKITVNNDLSLRREMTITGTDQKFEQTIRTIFFDKYDTYGNYIVKNINTNLRREAWIPISIILSLVISGYVFIRISLKLILMIFSLNFVYILLKLFLICFDNYNMAEYTSKKFPVVINEIIYFGNYFLNITGASTNYIIPVLIFLTMVMFNNFKRLSID